MWRKPQESKPQPSSEISPSPDPSPQRPVAAAPPLSPNAPACVPQGIAFKGEISGQGDLFFDGAFEGKIHIGDGSFTAGPNARVNADIEAREIIVRGDVTGTLKARERVQVSSTGRVTGQMETRGVVIEDGAVLRGKVKVQVRQEDQPPQPAPTAAPPRAKQAAATAAPQAKSPEQ